MRVLSVVRAATVSDLDACAELAGGVLHKPWFVQALSAPDVVFLVAEWAGAPVGFLIATLAGATATIEDFSVEAPGLWPSAGQHLLREARARLKRRNIRQIAVSGGSAAKEVLLRSEGLSFSGANWTAAA